MVEEWSALPKLSHVSLIVRDISKMMEFYCSHFGLTFGRRFESQSPAIAEAFGLETIFVRCVHLVFPGSAATLELQELNYHIAAGRQLPNMLGFRHICFDVDDIHEVYTQLSSQGVFFLSSPQEIRIPENSLFVRFCYLYDPEGNIVEIRQAEETRER